MSHHGEHHMPHELSRFAHRNKAALRAGDPATCTAMFELMNQRGCHVLADGKSYYKLPTDELGNTRYVTAAHMRRVWFNKLRMPDATQPHRPPINTFDAWCKWDGRRDGPSLLTMPNRADKRIWYRGYCKMMDARERAERAAIAAETTAQRDARWHREDAEGCERRYKRYAAVALADKLAADIEVQRIADARWHRQHGAAAA
jgi:hypothetical protein